MGNNKDILINMIKQQNRRLKHLILHVLNVMLTLKMSFKTSE